jgi:hypothetical protein
MDAKYVKFWSNSIRVARNNMERFSEEIKKKENIDSKAAPIKNLVIYGITKTYKQKEKPDQNLDKYISQSHKNLFLL